VKTFATVPRAEGRVARPCACCSGTSFTPLWGDLGGFSFVRCTGCGLVQQNPQPLPEAVRARYDGSYLAYEEERQFAYRELELLALRDLGIDGASFFAAASGEAGGAPAGDSVPAAAGVPRGAEAARPRVLDVGCATGALLAALRERGWEATGVELSPEQAAYGRVRFGLDIRTGTLEEAELPAGSFHLVHASHLIEHLNDPGSFLAECRRLLHPAGILVLTTPNIAGFQARLLGGAWRSAIHDHLYLFSLRQLASLLDRAGFRVDRRVTWGGWAAGLRPAFLKKPLDRAAKRYGLGDVCAVLARRKPD
jgi:2-polyprenyl-3-methyl-5-hydroxy-6-metoxy-1,4-benzoquinol methylase